MVSSHKLAVRTGANSREILNHMEENKNVKVSLYSDRLSVYCDKETSAIKGYCISLEG